MFFKPKHRFKLQGGNCDTHCSNALYFLYVWSTFYTSNTFKQSTFNKQNNLHKFNSVQPTLHINFKGKPVFFFPFRFFVLIPAGRIIFSFKCDIQILYPCRDLEQDKFGSNLNLQSQVRNINFIWKSNFLFLFKLHSLVISLKCLVIIPFMHFICTLTPRHSRSQMFWNSKLFLVPTFCMKVCGFLTMLKLDQTKTQAKYDW